MPADADARLPGATAGAASQLDTFRHYRHLTVELAISQFKLRYTGSVLGYFWSLLKPAMIFAIMYFIFVDLFKINDGTQFYGMQVLLGIVVWTFFAECTSSAMQAIASNGGLIRKAYFPRSILVIAASLSALFTFVINLLIVFVIAVALHQIDISLRIIVVLPLLLELYLLALGISLFLAALFVQYHDVSHLWEVLMQLLFYASGVMFSLTTCCSGCIWPWRSVRRSRSLRTCSGSCRSWPPIPSCRTSRTSATPCSPPRPPGPSWSSPATWPPSTSTPPWTSPGRCRCRSSPCSWW